MGKSKKKKKKTQSTVQKDESIPDLRQLLSKRNLVVTGLKAVLINRLLEADAAAAADNGDDGEDDDVADEGERDDGADDEDEEPAET